MAMTGGVAVAVAVGFIGVVLLSERVKILSGLLYAGIFNRPGVAGAVL